MPLCMTVEGLGQMTRCQSSAYKGERRRKPVFQTRGGGGGARRLVSSLDVKRTMKDHMHESAR